ncbi:retrotransposon protein, putative, unclassified [Tanacetum coccineum]
MGRLTCLLTTQEEPAWLWHSRLEACELLLVKKIGRKEYGIRSLLKGRNVPREFWGEVVRHAVYLLNRLPSKSLPDITPYEAWFGVHLRKLDDRGKKMVYLGVEDETKGNRLYYPQDMKLRVNRDVVFDEKEGWNWSKDKKEERPMANTFTIIKPQP